MTGASLAGLLTWSRYRWRFVRWTRVNGSGLGVGDSEQLARLLAAHIVEHRLVAQYAEAWTRVMTGGAAYNAEEREAIAAYLYPLRPSANAEHRQSCVAEYLWHVLNIEDSGEPDLVRIRKPKFYPTAPGGDGFTVRRDGGLTFTLWEIKKHVGNHLTTTIREAYEQLSRNAPRYLAEYSEAEQAVVDPDEARVFVNLVGDWLAGAPHMKAGVAVAASATPSRCFSTMQRHFSRLRGPDPCRGLLASIPQFDQFAQRVAEIVWTGL